jgi:membrane-associated phospholipid phosphatase
MNDLLQLQIPFILWLQSLNPALDALVNAVNFLQTEEFFLVALPIVWWCVNKRIGASLAILFLSSDFLVRYLKSVTGMPRPYQFDPRVRILDPQTDSAFPSAGALDTTLFWGYLALQLRRRALWAWAVVAIILVALARVYLGAHFPTDVIAGLLFGAVILAIVGGGSVIERIAAAPRVAQWLAALAWPLVLAVALLSPETAIPLGALLGFNIGLLIETRFVRFDPRGAWWRQIAKIVIGLAVGLGLRLALKPLLPSGDLFAFVRYAVIGLWMGAGAPWVFVMAKLAGKEQPSSR